MEEYLQLTTVRHGLLAEADVNFQPIVNRATAREAEDRIVSIWLPGNFR